MPHPRRRPSGIGGGRRSISGDHRNLSAYGVLTRANAPIVARLTPAVANQADRVENVSSNGSPLAKPSGKISSTRRSRYCAIERCHAVMPFASTVTPSTTGMLNSYHVAQRYSCSSDTNAMFQLRYLNMTCSLLRLRRYGRFFTDQLQATADAGRENCRNASAPARFSNRMPNRSRLREYDDFRNCRARRPFARCTALSFPEERGTTHQRGGASFRAKVRRNKGKGEPPHE